MSRRIDSDKVKTIQAKHMKPKEIYFMTGGHEMGYDFQPCTLVQILKTAADCKKYDVSTSHKGLAVVKIVSEGIKNKKALVSHVFDKIEWKEEVEPCT